MAPNTSILSHIWVRPELNQAALCDDGQSSTLQSIDLVLGKGSISPHAVPVEYFLRAIERPDDFGEDTVDKNSPEQVAKALEYIAHTARWFARCQDSTCVLKILLSVAGGFVLRSDYLNIRFYGCSRVLDRRPFASPRCQVDALPSTPTQQSWNKLFRSSVGALRVSTGLAGFQATMELLAQDIKERLSVRWIFPTPLDRTRLIMVALRLPEAVKHILAVVRSLGISLVVLGPPNSWLHLEHSTDLVDEYIPVDLSPDSGLQERIETAIERQDTSQTGIVTFTDNCVVAVARVAQKLGLWSPPPEALARVTNKQLTDPTRKPDENLIIVNEIRDIHRLTTDNPSIFHYPLIVKPTSGSGSKGVFKALNKAELVTAVNAAKAIYPTTKVMIEEYIDGPEFDINFVLHDGEILFHEVVDGVPCSADLAGPGEAGDFSELNAIWPSKHPAQELALIRDVLHRKLLSLDLPTGLFHVEGRLRHSAVHYAWEDGVLDLVPSRDRSPTASDVFLLEINARAPGHASTISTRLNNGVDYQAIQIMAAMNDWDRYRALARQFRSGAQHCCDAVFINTTGWGRVMNADLMSQLRLNRPDLVQHVMYYLSWYEDGEKVRVLPDRVGLFLVGNRSRREARRIAQDIRAAVDIGLVEIPSVQLSL